MRSNFTVCAALLQTIWSPLSTGSPVCPSIVKNACSSPPCTTILISDKSTTTKALCVSECGHTGVTTNASTAGINIGPPAANEYAVDPVGVDTITPSAL